MRYAVNLTIRYRYEALASASRHIVRLVPADLPGEQRLIAGALSVTPKPDEWVGRTDFFGNACAEVAFREAHRDIVFAVKSRVDVAERGRALDMSPEPADLAAQIAAYRRLDGRAPHHFTGSSRRAPVEPRTTNYARRAASTAQSVLAAVRAVGEAIHGDFRYAPLTTTVDTPMLDAFATRHGVCQDFSHIMISALRGIGIPAGYVSGFLRTDPPPGQPRLEGADAMHAWVCAWCGSDLGWVEYDPTNGVLAGVDHIVIARGRDYSDVTPVLGVTRTSGPHNSIQSVDVIPAA